MTHVRALLIPCAILLAIFVSVACGQEVDIAGLSAQLSVESSGLQKAQPDLQTKREALKNEAAEVERQKENVEKLKSATREGSDSSDPPALADAEKALASAREAFEQHRQEYAKARQEYDQRLRDYNDRLAQLNSALPKAVQEAGAPFPTEDELEATAGEYQVENLELLSGELKGKTVGDGAPASLLQEVAKAPQPAEWAKGDKVVQATIRPGTPIATFNSEGSFGEGAGSHAAIFITQNKNGIWVYDQYKTAAGLQRAIEARFIRNRAGSGSPSNDASAYFVVVKRAQDAPGEPAEIEPVKEEPVPTEKSRQPEESKPTESRESLAPSETPGPGDPASN
jgi:hypothetical protein